MPTAGARFAFLLVSFIFLAAGTARANTDLDTYGFGGRAPAMGGAFTALASDYTAVYYNPAGLVNTRSGAVGAGFSFADVSLTFDSEGGAVDDGDVERVDDLSAITLGLSKTLGEPGTIAGRFSAGIGLFFPTRKVVGATVRTAPGEPRFIMYGEQRDKVTIIPGLGVKILETASGHVLALGIGMSVLADISGTFEVNVFGGTRPFVVEQELDYDATPHFGIFWWPIRFLSFGIAYRGEISLKADLDAKIDVDGDPATPADVTLDLEAVTLFSPEQVQFGVAIDATDWLTIAVDVTYLRWSEFEDPFLVVEPGAGQVDPDFDDIFIPRLGIEIAPVRWIALRAGYFFQPTPVPEQDETGADETNILDADKHVLSGGVGFYYWRQEDVIEERPDGEKVVKQAWKNPFSADVFFQVHILEEETVEKNPASPQVGTGYDIGGTVINFGFFFTLRF